jgi:subtilisin family serine protease
MSRVYDHPVSLPSYRVSEIIPNRIELNKIRASFIGADREDATGWGLGRAKIPSAWSKGKGAGIKVAIIDSGISNHQDINGAVVDRINLSSELTTEDLSGHGTFIAGIIAARLNHDGIVGVAPECELYCAKVLDSSNAGDLDDVIDGFEWAFSKDVNIISCSIDILDHPANLLGISKLYELIKKATRRNKLVVTCAGNNGPASNSISYPGKFDNTITVGSIAINGALADSSGRGKTLDFVAPGVDIYSLLPGGGYTRQSGTSFSTPFIAGMAALILSMEREGYLSLNPDVPKFYAMLNQLKSMTGMTTQTNDIGFGLPVFNIS